MNKINFKTGTIIPPELMNALQNPSFTNDEEEAGHLPLPPNYGDPFVLQNIISNYRVLVNCFFKFLYCEFHKIIILLWHRNFTYNIL